MTASQRGMLLRRLGDLIARDAAKLAATEVRDNGKLIAEMQGQLNYMPQWYYYFGGLADKIEGAVIPLDKKGYFNFTRHEPVGVVAAITPWNSPLLLLAWKLAPALAAGCTVVVKPSEFTSASTLEFAEAGRGGRLPARRGQRRHRLRRARSARRWSSIRWCARSLHRLGRHRARSSTSRRPRASSASRSSWAASRPTSCSTTPTSRTRSTARSPASSPPPARPASPARACWCRTASTTLRREAARARAAPRAWAIR